MLGSQLVDAMPSNGRNDPIAHIPAVADQRAWPNFLHGDVVQPVVEPGLDGRCMPVGADLEAGFVLVENPPQLRCDLVPSLAGQIFAGAPSLAVAEVDDGSPPSVGILVDRAFSVSTLTA